MTRPNWSDLGWVGALGMLSLSLWLGGFLVSRDNPVWGASSGKGLEEEQIGSSNSLQSQSPQGSQPFGWYEEQLRNSEQWQTMNPEEKDRALKQIEQMREQFLKRRKQLEFQYQGSGNP